MLELQELSSWRFLHGFHRVNNLHCPTEGLIES